MVMLRQALLPVLVIALIVTGCSSGSSTKRTVTVVNTITSGAPASGAPKTSSVVVVSPSVPATAAPKTTPKPTPTTTSVAAAPIVKVDPTKADCATILDATDIKKAIGVTVANNTNRIRLGAAAHGVTGAIRCLYGSKDAGKSAPVRIRLTQYSSAAAAKTQVLVDVQAAQDGGALISKSTVNGYPATLQLQAGGVIEMSYDTWTMSIAVSDKLTTAAMLTKGLPTLAGQVLVRVIKS